LESLRESAHPQDIDIDVRIILKWNLQKYGLGVWVKFFCLKIGTNGGLL
jgi:hypothetical protein